MTPRDLLREGTEGHYRDAAYYDHAYARRKADIAHYVELARTSGGPVLELGVGTGRVAEAIARLGLDVVGVDLMATMLTRAKARLARSPELRSRVTLHRGDLRDLAKLGLGRFPLVISPFNVFMHLYTRDDVERALGTVRNHLTDGASFAFDVLNPDPGALARDPARLYRCGFVKPPGRPRAKYSESFDYDPVTQVQHVTMVFEPTDDPKAAPFIQRLAHRQFFPSELAALLHYNDFEIVSRRGGFEGEPFDAQAESQVLVTRARARRSST